MKVLIQSYNSCAQNKSGGVQERIRRTASRLMDCGIEVELFNKFKSDIRECDILHIFGLDYENLSLINCAKKMGKRVVISTILPLADGYKYDLYRLLMKFPLATTYRIIIAEAKAADLLIVETDKEAEFIAKHLGIDKNKMITIPNGIDPVTDTNDCIYSFLPTRNKYILQVGRFDENKNQLNVIRAMKKHPIDVLFIGASDHTSDSYYNQCVKEAEGCKQFHFLGWLPAKSDELISAYTHAEVLVLPSYHETFGMVALEGAAAGAKIALSNTLPIREYAAFSNCPCFDPSNISDIQKTLDETFGAPKTEKLRQQVLEEFSWDEVIKKHIESYQRLLEK